MKRISKGNYCNDQKEVEATQTDDKEGSVLLGRGVEKPH